MDLLLETLSPFIAKGNEAVELKLIRSASDIEDDTKIFKPEMSHQIFGDSEKIFGYMDLKIKLYCSAAWLTTYVGVEYTEKVEPKDFEGVTPDNIIKILSEWLQPGFLTNVDEFEKSLEKEESFKPLGELKHVFKIIEEDKVEKTFEVYHCNKDTKGFLTYHERMQPFLIWYIDAASYIDVDDEKWQFFIMYEKYTTSDKKNMYSFAGYLTAYEYYAYPLNIRPRISQVMVLPPYQRKGLCTHFLTTVYNHYLSNNTVVDITVEDPTEDFQSVRDFVDICRCEILDSYKPDNLKVGFSEDMVKDAKNHSKINKKQARRVYEILRLKATNINDKEDYKQYRLCVKRRLNMPFEREQAYFKKLKMCLTKKEYKETVKNFGQRIEKLEKQYKELEEQYMHVLERYDNQKHIFVPV